MLVEILLIVITFLLVFMSVGVWMINKNIVEAYFQLKND